MNSKEYVKFWKKKKKNEEKRESRMISERKYSLA